jgi:predicted  nucleic acid-binding Zn-ribbon protein
MITNEQYQEAYTIIQQKEASIMLSLKEAMKELKPCVDATAASIQEIKDTMPSIKTNDTTARQFVSTIDGQIRSFVNQITYLNQTMDSIIANLVPADAE